MFFYFAKLHQEHLLPIYPVVVFSFDEPKREERKQYQVEFPFFEGTGIQLHINSTQSAKLAGFSATAKSSGSRINGESSAEGGFPAVGNWRKRCGSEERASPEGQKCELPQKSVQG